MIIPLSLYPIGIVFATWQGLNAIQASNSQHQQESCR